ncbi:MAG: class I SAM-dependent methyltransferase [Candidatus Methylacidiphilales bacterium]|nr:class I SAM-dependent methyltransferase [Candidatus Methylacidiphilales bacterium]
MNKWISAELLEEFQSAGTNSHRLFSSRDAWIERLGRDILISHKTQESLELCLSGLKDWPGKSLFQPDRIFARFLPKQNADRQSPVLLEGDAALSPETVVMENGVRYGIDFTAGYAAGLFLDQRANRAFVRQLGIKGKKTLNTFAYTCSFSVVAAVAGAETLSLDLSKKSLDRGKGNFELNGLSLDGHRFIADDVLDVLPRLDKRGEKFDLIILDPPTFSLGNRGRKWKVEDQMEDLIASALELAAPGAWLLVSTNCTKIDRFSLERMAKFALKRARTHATTHHEPALPDFPQNEGAVTLWLKLH